MNDPTRRAHGLPSREIAGSFTSWFVCPRFVSLSEATKREAPPMIGAVVPGHHAFKRRAVLDAVNALRFASTPRSAGPSGIDGVCAPRVSLAFA